MASQTADRQSLARRAKSCGLRKIRLYIPLLDKDTPFQQDAICVLTHEQTHYLRHVMRCAVGEQVLVFNGRDGEWQAEIVALGKKQGKLCLRHQTRPQTKLPDLWLLFAPIKHLRLDFVAQKATEMGAAQLRPIMTRRTQAATHRRVNLARLHANAVEAAEQCGLLQVPDIAPPQTLTDLLAEWETIAPMRQIVFCDESADKHSGLADLAALRGKPVALLIGPEGGFDEAERAQLLVRHDVCRISLGPRVLRADTAAIAGLAACQILFGDWLADKVVTDDLHNRHK